MSSIALEYYEALKEHDDVEQRLWHAEQREPNGSYTEELYRRLDFAQERLREAEEDLFRWGRELVQSEKGQRHIKQQGLSQAGLLKRLDAPKDARRRLAQIVLEFPGA